MRKKISVLVVATIVAVGATWSFIQNSNENNISDLTLSNIEALATGEEMPDNADCSTYGRYRWCYRIYINDVYFDTFWVYPHS